MTIDFDEWYEDPHEQMDLNDFYIGGNPHIESKEWDEDSDSRFNSYFHIEGWSEEDFEHFDSGASHSQHLTPSLLLEYWQVKHFALNEAQQEQFLIHPFAVKICVIFTLADLENLSYVPRKLEDLYNYLNGSN